MATLVNIILKMHFVSLIPFFAALVSASFKVGNFVEITGLVSSPEFNGSVAMVVNPEAANGRVNVHLLVKDEDTFKFGDLGVKPEKLIAPKFKVSPKRSLEEILAFMSETGGIISSFKHEEMSPEKMIVIEQVVEFIRSLCNGVPNRISRDSEVERKVRIVGAWVNYNLGHAAMVSVAELDRSMLRYIERAWDGIGAWQR
jgi:hypothetical protein